jgi:hypothetical protein
MDLGTIFPAARSAGLGITALAMLEWDEEMRRAAIRAVGAEEIMVCFDEGIRRTSSMKRYQEPHCYKTLLM